MDKEYFKKLNDQPYDWNKIAGMDKILESENGRFSMYLGGLGYVTPETLDECKITSVLSLMPPGDAYTFGIEDNQNITQKLIEVDDAPEADLAQYFDTCFEFIDKEITKGNIFIHCVAGVSRSASVVIAYLMKTQKKSLKEAYAFVKERRQ